MWSTNSFIYLLGNQLHVDELISISFLLSAPLKTSLSSHVSPSNVILYVYVSQHVCAYYLFLFQNRFVFFDKLVLNQTNPNNTTVLNTELHTTYFQSCNVTFFI